MSSIKELLEKRVRPIEDALCKIMVGQRQVIKRVTMALFAVGQRDFHSDGSRFLGTGHVLCEGGVGTGKCLAKGTPVLMFSGEIKLVEEVRIGDLLMGPDSLPRRVVSLGYGHSMMYKVIPIKGEPYVVNDEHILSLTTRRKKGQRRVVHNISVKDYLTKNKTFKHNIKGYRVGVEFADKSVSLDPYFLGLWLGDGTSCNSEITNCDEEVISYCRSFAESLGLRLVKKTYKNRTPVYALSSIYDPSVPRGHFNPIKRSLQELNLILNKHIPDVYKHNCSTVRLQVLAGLIDTDGSLSGGGYDYVSKVKTLADDVVYLARSLGLAAYLKECEKTCANNEVIGTYYRVFISGNVSQIPVKIARKKAGERKQKKDVLVTGITVEPVGYGEYYGFEISGPDRLFLLGDFTVTHNTVLCKALSRLLAGNNKRVSGMPDSLAGDITGCEIILLTGDTKVVKGPLFCNVILADEINRFPPKAQNAFIEALAEGSVTIANETFRLDQPFFCLATQNPTEQKGTSRLQEALSDRFMFKLVMKETSEEEKMEIARRTHKFDLTNLEQIVEPWQVYEAREYFFDNTYVCDAVRRYCARILHGINHPEKFGLYKKERNLLKEAELFKQKPALNDRAMLHLEGAAMMEAIMNGRDFVIPADVSNVATDVLRARLMLQESSLYLLMEMHENKTETEIIDYFIDEVLEKVSVV